MAWDFETDPEFQKMVAEFDEKTGAIQMTS